MHHLKALLLLAGVSRVIHGAHKAPYRLVTATAGDDVRLHCATSGNISSLRWRHGDSPASTTILFCGWQGGVPSCHATPRASVTFAGDLRLGDGSVVLEAVALSAGGVYECVYESTVEAGGRAVRRYRLSVSDERQRHVREGHPSVMAFEGEEVTLDCDAPSRIETLRWRHFHLPAAAAIAAATAAATAPAHAETVLYCTSRPVPSCLATPTNPFAVFSGNLSAGRGSIVLASIPLSASGLYQCLLATGGASPGYLECNHSVTVMRKETTAHLTAQVSGKPGPSPSKRSLSSRPPFHTRRPPFYTRRPPFYTHRPPFYTRRPPFYTRRPPFYTRRPPFYTHRLPFYTRPSCVATAVAIFCAGAVALLLGAACLGRHLRERGGRGRAPRAQ
ncbi:uncharacterized protein LOC144738400 [Lampetra planeri]